jgi:hypothetical protein
VYFSIVKNTVLIYQASFASSTLSACVKWANDHLKTFNTLLVRQLSAIESNSKLWRDCMDVVWTHERQMLGEVGLDFREVISRGLEVNYVPSGKAGMANGGSQERSRSKSGARTNT